ncbi:uncharacterized protein LOC124887109 [Capsicum annuum]|uniref:uncharacterized protein LOC124887109 n=1 Tax=Capsicum annuum TaxID=4072 RepID=UPI001FB162B8|nr:uncharacterized protein LOC124887109 [Capsicum annuum]
MGSLDVASQSIESGTARELVINIVNITIYFHYGGDWVTQPGILYQKGSVQYWKGYDPDLLSFIDLVNEYTSRFGFVIVQQLIVLGPFGKFFKIQGDEGIRTLLSFVSEDYQSIHLFATDDCELSVDVLDIVKHSSSFLLAPIFDEAGIDCSDTESDSEVVFSCSEYDTDESKNFVEKKRRTIKASLQDYKEIFRGMSFKDISEAIQFCKLYALSKKVELVMVKSDKKRLRYTCRADGCPFQLLIFEDDTTPGASVKKLVDHIDPHLNGYDNNIIDYFTIAYYFKKKIQSDPKYRVKDMKDDLHRVFEVNVSEAKCKRIGFKAGLRPLIGLDVIFLKGKIKGQLLVAVGQDSMNCFYPIAWAVVDKETKRTWTWFLKHLKHLLELQSGKRITFISDMQKGLVDIVQNILLDAHHRYCPVRGEIFWKIDLSQAIKPQKMVKHGGRPKEKRERQKEEALKRQGEWKQSRKGLLMSCGICGLPNRNSRSCAKRTKQAAGKKKEPTGEKK